MCGGKPDTAFYCKFSAESKDEEIVKSANNAKVMNE